MVNIIVVFRKLDDAKKIRSILQRHGFTVTACCSTGLQAIGLFDDLRNGIVICGYQMTDMLYTEIRENLPEDFQMLLMARENLLPQLVDNDLVCLPMPARAGDLVQTVAMMQNAVEIRIKKRKSRLTGIYKKQRWIREHRWWRPPRWCWISSVCNNGDGSDGLQLSSVNRRKHHLHRKTQVLSVSLKRLKPF